MFRQAWNRASHKLSSVMGKFCLLMFDLKLFCYSTNFLLTITITSMLQGDPSRPTRWAIVGCGVISNDFCFALRTSSQHEHKVYMHGSCIDLLDF